MGLKKRSKVSAEFSMSSLTDIIFLLLIFFMLTSTLVSPHSLNLKLPGSGNPTTSNEDPPEITISSSGKVKLDGKTIGEPIVENLTKEINRLVRAEGRKPDIVVSSHNDSEAQVFAQVLDVFQNLEMEPILALEE